MAQRIHIGIDPGKKGGFAAIFHGKVLYSNKTPTRKGEYELNKMVRLLKASGYGNPIVHIEKVSARPHEGVTSSFTFGRGVGLWVGMASALGYPINSVSPVAWKKHFNLLKTEKIDSVNKVKELFPNVPLIPDRCRVESDGLSEAILLAKYGEDTYGN